MQDGGLEVEKNNRTIDNNWVVPYSPYLSLRYNAHINVEICASPRATKYLYKYINKGSDRAMMRVNEEGQPEKRNEVKEFQDCRSIGASEVAFRLFEFPMRRRYPGVIRLPIHLEKQQSVYFHEERLLKMFWEDLMKQNLQHSLSTIPTTQIQKCHISPSQNNLYFRKRIRNGQLGNEAQIHLDAFILYIHQKESYFIYECF